MNVSSNNGLAGYSVTLPGNSFGPATQEAAMPGLTNPAANYER
ncbi:MAG: hypothetical protein ACYTF7_05115 [Planctomycetota bacterium]